MKEFRCLVGVRHPPRPLAAAVRDRICRIAPSLENVEKIETVSRVERPEGGAALVNEWRVNPDLPPGLDGFITPDMLGWLDHAEWSADLTRCEWRIEPFFMAEAIRWFYAIRAGPAASCTAASRSNHSYSNLMVVMATALVPASRSGNA